MTDTARKITGTSALLLVGAMVALGASPDAFARFVNFGSYYTADGAVVSVGASSLTIDPGTDNLITIQVTPETRFAKKGSLSDIEPGDTIRSRFYASGGQYLAQTVAFDKGSYGNAGEKVRVQWGYVTGKTASSFTVQIRPSVFVTFLVTAQTKFNGQGVKTFAELSVNDTVRIQGTDNGGSFVAKVVHVEQRPRR